MLGATDAELRPPAAVSARAAADREALASGQAQFECTPIDGSGTVCGDVLDLAPETGGAAGFGVVLRAVEHADLHPAGELRKRPRRRAA